MSEDTLILGHNQRARELKLAALKLKIVPPQGKGRDLTLSRSEIHIGKDEANTIVLEDPAVSRLHCVIFLRKGLYFVQDAHSSNGTILNGAPVNEGILRPGDKLHLGRTLVEVEGTEKVTPLGVHRSQCFQGMVATSKGMRYIFTFIEKVAPLNLVVSITGESGTGKELVARALHELSPRKKGPFVALNCTAINGNLFESELFGHEKGAFTGADRRHAGAIEQANGGTLFLDEIGDMPPSLQPVLLRFLENKTYRRVGGLLEEKGDARVVVATNKDLKGLVTKGEFREDLYYRLNVIPISLPPLRKRIEDIELLVQHFLNNLSTPEKRLSLGEGALRKLSRHLWQGNIRELRNTLQRAAVLTESGVIDPEDIILERLDKKQEKEILEDSIQKAGSIRKAAIILGVNRSSLMRRLRKLKISG